MALWRREWPSTPAFLPGESHGQKSLAATVHKVTKSQMQLNDSTTTTTTTIITTTTTTTTTTDG